MPTLLKIYEAYGEYDKPWIDEFVPLVLEYGPMEFAQDIFTDENGEGAHVNSPQECYEMLKAFITAMAPTL